MWSKVGNSSIFMREVIATLILYGFEQKKCFFQVWSWVKFNNLGLALDERESLHQCGQKGKTKSQKVLRANSYICRSYREKNM